MAEKTFLRTGTGHYSAEAATLDSDVDLAAVAAEASFAAIPATSYADDAAAATAGVKVGELYHTSGAVKRRMA